MAWPADPIVLPDATPGFMSAAQFDALVAARLNALRLLVLANTADTGRIAITYNGGVGPVPSFSRPLTYRAKNGFLCISGNFALTSGSTFGAGATNQGIANAGAIPTALVPSAAMDPNFEVFGSNNAPGKLVVGQDGSLLFNNGPTPVTNVSVNIIYPTG